MKKSILSLMIVFLSLTFAQAQINSETERTATSLPVTDPSNTAKAEVLITRLNEINNMDKSNLTSSEKKELRKEVRSTKKELSVLNGGVYLSVGAVILIVLLLILLF